MSEAKGCLSRLAMVNDTFHIVRTIRDRVQFIEKLREFAVREDKARLLERIFVI